MLQWPAIDHDLARLTCRALNRCGKRHLIARPGHIEVGHILDPEGDSDEYVWTLQSHTIDGIMNGLAEEVGLARRMWRLSAPHCQCVRQCQRSAKAPTVTVTTLAGHVSTVVVFDCSARNARSARIALGSRLLRRHSGTRNVSPRSSSERRRAIRTRLRFPRSNGPPE